MLLKLSVIFVIFALIASIDATTYECTAVTSVLDPTLCNGRGYCRGTEPNTLGCSCQSGWGGDCDFAIADLDTCAKAVTSDVSQFATEIGGGFEDGSVMISVTADVEQSKEEGLYNYATYTELYFRNQDECDYPEGPSATWTKSFNAAAGPDEACTETYTGEFDLSDLFGCTGAAGNAVCYQGSTEIECDAQYCHTPPCRRCYPGQVQAVRGYRRESESGRISTDSTAENCHYFSVCLPWIAEVDTNIHVTRIPNVDNEMLIKRVAFSCFELIEVIDCHGEKSWVVEILSVVEFPWFIREEGTNTAGLSDGTDYYDLVSIEEDCDGRTDCDCTSESAEGKKCVQKLSFRIPGCSTLETSRTYDFVGLTYDCRGDCEAARDAAVADGGDLSVEGDVILQATGDNCGDDLVIDATDSLTLSMSSYLEDWTTFNTVFIADDETLQNAYFIVEAVTNVEVDSIVIIDVLRDYLTTIGETGFGFTEETTNCPDPTDPNTYYACFWTSIEDLESEIQLDELLTARFTAIVEINYAGTSTKRSVGLSNSQQLSRNIKVIPKITGVENASPAFAIAVLALIAALLF